MNLVMLEPHEVDEAGEVTLAGVRAAHLVDMLKVTQDSVVRIALLDGPHGTATVIARAGATLTLRCRFETDPPPRPPVDLLLALPRPKVMRRLWAQLAALGVGRIMLTNAERVERNYFDSHVLDPSVYRPLLIEGLQQARDTRLPLVSIHRQFKVLIEDHLDVLSPDTIRVMADPAAASPLDAAVAASLPIKAAVAASLPIKAAVAASLPIKAAVAASLPIKAAVAKHPGPRLLLAIGAEGGWSAYERSLLGAHGFVAAGMGQRTLRSDTACIALLALAHRAVAG